MTILSVLSMSADITAAINWRIVGFKPQCLVRYKGICGRMRFIKTIPSKLFYRVEGRHRQFAVDAIIDSAFFKDATLFGHFFQVFLTIARRNITPPKYSQTIPEQSALPALG
ncbi:hypothetical protein PEC18_09920, partial [Paucibacter sp. O1-1]|nr:hypothetical protein [Paucibacter sp. O1-1]MDA3826164.1 hypothetical protein [Paucibacter sp. O1-1]